MATKKNLRGTKRLRYADCPECLGINPYKCIESDDLHQQINANLAAGPQFVLRPLSNEETQAFHNRQVAAMHAFNERHGNDPRLRQIIPREFIRTSTRIQK